MVPALDGKPSVCVKRIAKPVERTAVEKFYKQRPVPGKHIHEVVKLQNKTMDARFANEVAVLEQRTSSPVFQPHWLAQANATQMQHTKQRLDNLLAKDTPLFCSQPSSVSILPLWHSTSSAAAAGIAVGGFASLSTTDDGYFARGIYGTPEAEYANKYQGAVLLLNVVTFINPYPVTMEEYEPSWQSKFYAKPLPENYDANFIPVTNLANYPAVQQQQYLAAFHSFLVPGSLCYVPCKDGMVPDYHELVVAESSRCLPMFEVTLADDMVMPVPTAVAVLPDTPAIVAKKQEIQDKHQRILALQQEYQATADKTEITKRLGSAFKGLGQSQYQLANLLLRRDSDMLKQESEGILLETVGNYQHAMSLDPGRHSNWHTLKHCANVLLDIGDLDGARRYFGEASQNAEQAGDRLEASFYQRRGYALFLQGDWAAATQDFGQASIITGNPPHPPLTAPARRRTCVVS